MLKKTTIYAAFALLAGTVASFGQMLDRDRDPSVAVSAASQPHPATPAEVKANANFVFSKEPGATADFMTTINKWLAANFELPEATELPQIEFVPPRKLAAMRYKGTVSDQWREDSIPDNAIQAAYQREVVALYNDATRTIYLPQFWTGATPVEQSVLVHEMVHHLQNLGAHKYNCPAAREKLAYEAQAEWLKLHDLSLEEEFDLDMLTLLITSTCMN